LYAAVDADSKLLLDLDVYSHRGTDPEAEFLHRLTEKHDVSETVLLVDGGRHPTVSLRHESSGQLNYRDRNHLEKLFQTVTMRIDRFHSIWTGSSASARRWPNKFKYHYS